MSRPPVFVPPEVVEDAIALLTATVDDYREAFAAGAVARTIAGLRHALQNAERPAPGEEEPASAVDRGDR